MQLLVAMRNAGRNKDRRSCWRLLFVASKSKVECALKHMPGLVVSMMDVEVCGTTARPFMNRVGEASRVNRRLVGGAVVGSRDDRWFGCHRLLHFMHVLYRATLSQPMMVTAGSRKPVRERSPAGSMSTS